MANDKRYYIVFHFRTHDSTFRGKTYIVYGKEKDKKYAYFCEKGDKPKLYKSEKTANIAAIKLVNSCENVCENYSIKETTEYTDVEQEDDKRLKQCPFCGSSVGLYQKIEARQMYTFNGDKGTLFIEDNLMYCDNCKKSLMTSEEFEKMYGVILPKLM